MMTRPLRLLVLPALGAVLIAVSAGASAGAQAASPTPIDLMYRTTTGGLVVARVVRTTWRLHLEGDAAVLTRLSEADAHTEHGGPPGQPLRAPRRPDATSIRNLAKLTWTPRMTQVSVGHVTRDATTLTAELVGVVTSRRAPTEPVTLQATTLSCRRDTVRALPMGSVPKERPRGAENKHSDPGDKAYGVPPQWTHAGDAKLIPGWACTLTFGTDPDPGGAVFFGDPAVEYVYENNDFEQGGATRIADP